MSERKPLLIELGCEELPPKALDALGQAFADSFVASLDALGIEADSAAARAWVTPRRLAVHIPAVASEQSEQTIERRGPSVAVGLDDAGEATKALAGFARSCGVEPEQLQRIDTPKGQWFAWRATEPGKTLGELLQQMLEAAIKALPIPRPMRWGDHDYSFARPVHWLLALHGDEVIDVATMGVRSGRQTHGHRFHHPAPVHVADADSWLGALRAAKVLADPDERRALIEDRCRALAAEHGLEPAPMHPEALMHELVNITEWPVPLLCRFDDDYLALPSEVLRTTMEADQSFIALADKDRGDDQDAISSRFIAIANIESKDVARVREGYERVIRPRFADAQFFYREDMNTPLTDHQDGLAKVTYQKDLGSIWDKCTRVAELARVIANRSGVDAARATQAAALAKCDLLTRMVGEFPALQGVMGYHYARQQGQDAEVARALEGSYRPRHAGDAIATEPLSKVLAVAERLDTLAGIFAVGLKPSGTKDPFALRRDALGLARTLIEGDMDLDIEALAIEALQLLPEAALAAGHARAHKGDDAPPFDAAATRAALRAEIIGFVLERLRGYYADRGFASQAFEAVRAVSPRSLSDFDRRMHAVAEFTRLPEAEQLAAANKRVGNILRKQADVESLPRHVDEALFEHDAERALAAAVAEHGQASRAQYAAGDYTGALRTLSALQPSVDRFFDEVMVMADDPTLRGNRLALLARLQARFMAIADIARLCA